MTERDDLDVLLADAYDDQRGRMDVPRPDRAGLDAAIDRREQHRRRVVGGAAFALVAVILTVGVVLTRAPGTEPTVFTSDQTVPTDGLVAPGSDAAWWGIDPTGSTTVTPWSGTTVDGPPEVDDARFVAELRSADDWRSTPAVSVLVTGRPAAEIAPLGTGVPNTIDGRDVYRFDDGQGYRELVVALDATSSLRLHAVGVEEATLLEIVEGAQVLGSELTFGPLPDGLRVIFSTPVDRDRYHRNTLTYEIPVDAPGGVDMNLAAVSSFDDPVYVAERTIQTLRSVDIGDPIPTTVGGSPGLRTQLATETIWRVDGLLHELTVLAAGQDPTALGTELADRARPLTDGERASLVIAPLSVDRWPRSQAEQVSYPIDDAAEARIAAFEQGLPEGFERFGGDPPPELNFDGIPVRTYDDRTDSWIDLTMVPSTTGPPTGDTSVRTTRDEGWSRQVRWRAPSGWTYALRADSKSSDDGPLTVDEMRALLESVDAVDAASTIPTDPPPGIVEDPTTDVTTS